MVPADSPNDAVESFIARWEHSGSAERANYQLFLSELCDLLGVPAPSSRQNPLRPSKRS
jgi:hypothetical protein